jgi:hypothetical protein
MINGNMNVGRHVPVSLSFLGPNVHDAVVLADSTSVPGSFVRTESVADGNQAINPWLRPGGGYVAMFTARAAELRADFDRDQDVDQEDYAVMQACLSGAYFPPTTACQRADFDLDNDVDTTDVGLFLQCYSGPDRNATANCMESP